MKNKGPRHTLIFALAPLVALLIASSAMADNLIDAYQLAAQSNPQLNAARANQAAFAEGYQQSKTRYYPEINLRANVNRHRDDTNASSGLFRSGVSRYNSQGYTLSLTQALYRRDYLVQKRQASAQQQEADAAYHSAEQALLLNIAQSYFDVLAAQDNLAFAQAEKEAINRQLEQTKQRFEVGLIAITGVHESHAAYDLAKANEIVAQNQLAVAHEALREITGELMADLAALGETMPLISPEPNDVKQWVERALAQNYELSSAKARIDAARQQLDLQRANRHPSINLVASHNYLDSGGVFGDRVSNNTALGVELSIPLYQGGGISAKIRQSQHLLEQAKHNQESQRRTVQRSTSEAYLNVIANISQVKAFKQAVVSSKSALEATEAGYDVGSRTTVDVLDSRRNLYRAERDYARVRYDYILSTLRLKQAAGMLAEEDISQINTWLQ